MPCLARAPKCNLEISYLLERMERFKGMAILATNRKKDLDEAFLRRLRYIVDFPLPGLEQRRALWQQVVPHGVDAAAVDYDLLANRFPLSGGSIRSIIFNACLQSASPGDDGQPAPARLAMEPIIVAIKREYDKMNRPVSLENFGQYTAVVNKLEGQP
jgi:SpoVK/Ycf46/Vps4 family AAA+-type ATPase